MPYLYHQSVILAHYEAEKRSYEGHLNEGHPPIPAYIHPYPPICVSYMHTQVSVGIATPYS